MTKTLTPKQEAFLEALLGEARGHIRAAMDIAEYSRTTKTAEVVGPRKEEITERAGMMLAMNAPKAAFGIVDVRDYPSAEGAMSSGKISFRSVWGSKIGGFTRFRPTHRGIHMPQHQYLRLPKHHVLVRLRKHFQHCRSFLYCRHAGMRLILRQLRQHVWLGSFLHQLKA